MDSLARLKLAIEKTKAYKLTHELVHDANDHIACSCKNLCYNEVVLTEMPTEKYNKCFLECMKSHGIITYDNTSLPIDCQETIL